MMRTIKIAVAWMVLHTFLYAQVAENKLELGLYSTSFDYNEYSSSGAWLDSEKTSISGIVGYQVSYWHKIADGWGGGNADHIILKHSYQKGQTDYSGFLQNLNSGALTPYATKTDNTLFDVQLLLNESNNFDDYFTQTYFGLGYRFWQRDSSSNSIYGYNEEYSWLYLVIGIGGEYKLSNSFSLGFDASYKYAINPQMYADIFGGLDFDLGKTYGYEIAFPLRYELSETFDILARFSYVYWEIEKSNVVSGFYEPDSTTKNFTLFIGFDYRFEL